MAGNRRVTLKDIAKAAGVHTSTVSRALDPNSTTSLTEEVAGRIRHLAKEMGYRPNRMAAGLRTNRSMSVGVMIPDISNMLFGPIVRGISAALDRAGYTIIIVNTDNLPKLEAQMIGVLVERGVDGIISVATITDGLALPDITGRDLPFITLNRRVETLPTPYVINDDAQGIRQILHHLKGLGHRRIAHIAGPQDTSTGILRLDTMRDECARLGLDFGPASWIESTGYVEVEGKRCTHALLDAGQPFTALVCANDLLAFGAYAALRDRGLSIPGDISVTGFNDDPILELVTPPLTTVRVPKFEAGRTCGELMLRLMKGEAPGAVGTILPVELVVRDSTGPAPGGPGAAG